MKILMAAIFTLLGVSVSRAASNSDVFSRWSELEAADRQMAADYASTLRARGYTEAQLPFDRIFPAYVNAVQNLVDQQEKKRDQLLGAIDARSSEGALSLAQGQRLKDRVDELFAARRYYFWGNFWRRMVLKTFVAGEDVSDDSAPAAVLGNRIDLAISDESLRQIQHEDEFDPADYGIDSDFFSGKSHVEVKIDAGR